jgi:S1-C subfamily serine protease
LARPSAVHRNLGRLGLYNGAIDGIVGPKTNQALKRWQTSKGYSGELSEQQVTELIDSEAARKTAEAKPKPKPTPQASASTSGSGFFVSKTGHVITNQHVVADCKKVTVGDKAFFFFLGILVVRLSRERTGD